MTTIPRIGPIHVDGLSTDLYGYKASDLAQFGETLDEAIKSFCESQSLEHRGHVVFSDATYIVFREKR